MKRRCEGTVFLVEDDASVRDALGRILSDLGCRVVACASAEEFLETPREDVPACLLLDVRLPGLSGLALRDRLDGRGPPVVFLTGHGDVPMAVDAIKKGAFDFLTKPVDEDDLMRAVHGALDKDRRAHADRAARAASRDRIGSLTPREREVFRQVIAGLPNKAIADNLGIALQTVKIHRGNLTAKLGVVSVVDLIDLARTAGVESDPIS